MIQRQFMMLAMSVATSPGVMGYSFPALCLRSNDFVRKRSQASYIIRHVSRPSLTASHRKGDDVFGIRTQTIIGYGSLLSEKSARTTFPDLINFRRGRVRNYRRVFGHPGSIFFRNGIADLPTLQIAAVDAEYDPGNPGFVVSAFDIPNKEGTDQPSRAFQKREAVYDFAKVPLLSLDGTERSENEGWISVRSTDHRYIEKWGNERFQNQFVNYGVHTIWNWPPDSGMLPCAVYLRHCYLAAKSGGLECLESFLDETFLNDRMTTIRWYLEQNPHVLDALPPPELFDRYNG